MLKHIIIVKFNLHTIEVEKKEAVERLKAMKDHIPEIIDIEAGLTVTDRSKGYDLGVDVLLEDLDALDRYQVNQHHVGVKAYLKEIGQVDSIALDFNIKLKK